MELVIKTFSELTTEELFDIYKLRVDVFVVEQECPYREVDDFDKSAVHVYLKDESGIAAYLRVLPPGTAYSTAALGRVIAAPSRRREGLGTAIVREGIRTAIERFGAETVSLAAQVYARGLYEKAGFRQVSEEFLDDGIPHIEMQLNVADFPEYKGRTESAACASEAGAAGGAGDSTGAEPEKKKSPTVRGGHLRDLLNYSDRF